MVTSSGGWPMSSDNFYPFGQEQNPTSDPNHYKFTGKERDAESGLDYFGARYYSSSMGRFMSPDWDAKPISVPYASFGDPQTLNLYSYVENGPLNRVDADGHVFGNPNSATPALIGFDGDDVAIACTGVWNCTHSYLEKQSFGGSLADAADEAAYDERVKQAFAEAAQQQSLSAAGLQFLENQETVGGVPNLTVYDASGKKHLGDFTIGYGHKVKAGEDFSKGITAGQAADLLKADAQTAVNAVNNALTSRTSSQAQFDALVSLAYNIGGGAFQRSTLVQRLNGGGAVEQDLFTRFDKTGGAVSPGLYARRERVHAVQHG
jgi:RHS repeat-associated protein